MGKILKYLDKIFKYFGKILKYLGRILKYFGKILKHMVQSDLCEQNMRERIRRLELLSECTAHICPRVAFVPESAQLLRVMLRLRLHQRAAALRRLMHYGTSRHRKVHGDQPAAQEVCHRDRQTPHLAASALRMSSSRSRAHL